ncbi:M81 family metallopeptidase [Paenibacillus cymbidii]|uniref:M81 family metallopeptidase n=1 Tax=Paenibacillus cymbidii TaxID=1639034 RepID=UPI0010806DCA|nr:M81 family metallopeptidase [Paenibacillus cymbidii]
MKIAVVGIMHETNTFAPRPTVMEHFHSEWVVGNDAFYKEYENTRTLIGGAIDGAKAEGAALACGLYTMAPPGGVVPRTVADELIALMLESLEQAADGIIAVLHGAMVAEGYPDMEGEIVRRLRAAAGERVPLVATLDLHANISAQMVEQTDMVVGFDTYPHIDIYERVFEGVQLLARLIRREIRPTSALVKPGMLVVPQVMVTDEEGPMKELMERAFAIERDPAVLNVTVAGGFPYSDIADAGMAFVVTTDGDKPAAERYAEELSRMARARRERFAYAARSAADAVAEAFQEEEGPVILVEGSDNVGGGAPADATHILAQLLHAPKKSLIVLYDEEGAALAHRLGVGGTFEAPIGGKSDHMHGEPVRITGVIRLLFDGKFVHNGPYMAGYRSNMGKSAVIECGQLTIVLTGKRVAPFDINLIRCVGLQAESFHVIVVKSAIAWKTAFGSVCRKVIPVDTPGCCASNLAYFQYEHLQRPIYPLDAV